MGEYRARKIHQVDPTTGKVLRSNESNCFVTGVAWLGNELWHATWEATKASYGAWTRSPARRWRVMSWFAAFCGLK